MDWDALLRTLPPVEFAFAYGSGVFAQRGYESAASPPMIDLVVAVRDSAAWHADNIGMNPAHYSSLRHLGPTLVARLQEGCGAGLYYNPGTMKYGVVSVRALVDDLLHWRTLYISGRMHKPVRILRCVDDDIYQASHENLRHAVRAALLMLPATFTAEQLYMTIAGLSYTGDFRMVFGENPHKVANIVSKNLTHFHRLYAPRLRATFPLHVCNANGQEGAVDGADEGGMTDNDVRGVTYQQDLSAESRLALGMALPLHLQHRMADAYFAQSLGEANYFYTAIMRRFRRNGQPPASIALTGGAGDADAHWHGARASSDTPSASSTTSPSPPGGARNDSAPAPMTARRALPRWLWGGLAAVRDKAGASMLRPRNPMPLSWDGSGPSPSPPDHLQGATPSHTFVYPVPVPSGSRPAAAWATVRVRTVARAIALAEAGRGLMQRIRQQRLQYLVAKRAAAQAAAAATASTKPGWAGAGEWGGDWSAAAEVAHILESASPLANANYAKAAHDPKIVAFWDSVLTTSRSHAMPGIGVGAMASGAMWIGRGDQVGALARGYLQPAIAHIVGVHARSQSVKGIITAGPTRAVVYGWAKLQKYVAAVGGGGKKVQAMAMAMGGLVMMRGGWGCDDVDDGWAT